MRIILIETLWSELLLIIVSKGWLPLKVNWLIWMHHILRIDLLWTTVNERLLRFVSYTGFKLTLEIRGYFEQIIKTLLMLIFKRRSSDHLRLFNYDRIIEGFIVWMIAFLILCPHFINLNINIFNSHLRLWLSELILAFFLLQLFLLIFLISMCGFSATHVFLNFFALRSFLSDHDRRIETVEYFLWEDAIVFILVNLWVCGLGEIVKHHCVLVVWARSSFSHSLSVYLRCLLCAWITVLLRVLALSLWIGCICGGL